MKLKRARSLTAQVLDDLLDRIARGEYALGERLPTGKKLAATYGVSTMVIREVTEHLRAHGYIESRQGIGCIVRAITPNSGFLLPSYPELDAAELTAIYELRLDLESAVAALAAERRTQEDVDVMEHILRRLEAALCDASSSATDQEFHVRIAAASGNKYHLQLLQYLNAQIYQTVRTAREHTQREEGLPEQVHREHVAIFEAIAARDPVMARAAAVSHLLRAMNRLGLRHRAPDATNPAASSAFRQLPAVHKKGH